MDLFEPFLSEDSCNGVNVGTVIVKVREATDLTAAFIAAGMMRKSGDAGCGSSLGEVYSLITEGDTTNTLSGSITLTYVIIAGSDNHFSGRMSFRRIHLVFCLEVRLGSLSKRLPSLGFSRKEARCAASICDGAHGAADATRTGFAVQPLFFCLIRGFVIVRGIGIDSSWWLSPSRFFFSVCRGREAGRCNQSLEQTAFRLAAELTYFGTRRCT